MTPWDGVRGEGPDRRQHPRRPKAATPYPSVTTHVSGLAGTVTNVVLTVNGFDHQAPRDVDLMLVGPHGQRALVMSDVGGASPVTDVDLVFDDSSTSYLNFDDTVTEGPTTPATTRRRRLPGAGSLGRRGYQLAVRLRRDRPERVLGPVRGRRPRGCMPARSSGGL